MELHAVDAGTCSRRDMGHRRGFDVGWAGGRTIEGAKEEVGGTDEEGKMKGIGAGTGRRPWPRRAAIRVPR